MNKSIIYIFMMISMIALSSAWQTNVTYNLNMTDDAGWFSTLSGTTREFTSLGNNSVYIVGSAGLFAKFSRETNLTYDYRGKDIGDWVGTTALNGIASHNGNVYVVGGSGKWGVYVESEDVLHDLRTTDIGDWVSGTALINDVAVDTDTGNVYMVGGSSFFGVYVLSENLTYDLRGTDIGDWFGGTSAFNDVVYDGSSGVYLVGNSGLIGYYNIAENVTYDLRETDTGNWVSTSSLRGASVDDNGNLYIGGSIGTVPLTFGIYNKSENITHDLSSLITWNTSSVIRHIGFNPVDKNVYLAIGGGGFGVYYPSSGTSIGLMDTSFEGWMLSLPVSDLNYPFKIGFDTQGNVYVGSGATPERFAVYIINATLQGAESPPEPPVVNGTCNVTGHPVLNYPSGNYTTDLNLTVSNVTGAVAYVFYEDNVVAQNSSSDTYLWSPLLAGVYNVTVFGYNSTCQSEMSDLYQYNYIIEIIPPTESPAQINYFGIFVFLLVLYMTARLMQGKTIPKMTGK